MTTVTTEQLQKDFVSVRSLIDRGKCFSLEEDGLLLGTFRPVVPATLQGKRVLGTLKCKISVRNDFDNMMRNEIEAMFYGQP